MQIVFNPTGTHVHKDMLKVRLDFFPEETDLTYQQQHVYVPILPESGYPGETGEMGSPVDSAAYQAWLDSLPHIWRLNPCLCHFVSIKESTTKEEIADYISRNFSKEALATLDSTLVLPDSIHRLRFLRSKCRLSLEKVKAKDRLDLMLSVNERFKNLGLNLSSNGKPLIIEPESIDIGPGATDRAEAGGDTFTMAAVDNPANATGIINSAEFWFNTNATGVKCGTFYGTGATRASRDYETIGDVTSGSKQTFTGLNCSVETGDYWGTYFATGAMDYVSGGGGNYYLAGDQFGTGSQTYTFGAATLSIYGTGEEPILLSISDGIKIGDTKSELMTASLSVSDGIGAGDSPSEAAAMSVSKTDGLKGSDTASLIAALLKEEGIKIGDSRILAMAAELTKTDGLKLSDNAYFVWELSLLEGLITGDTSSIEAALSIAEGLVASDEKTAAMEAQVSKTDGVKFSDIDSLIADLQASDGMTLADSRIISMLASLLRQEGLVISDEALLIKIGRIFKIIALTAINRDLKVNTAKNRDIKTITGGG